MGSKNQTSTTTTSQQHAPWAPAQGNLQTVLDKSGELAGDMSRWTPTYSGSTMTGIQGLETAAQNGSAAAGTLGQIIPQSTEGFGVGTDQLMKTASGGMIGANPYLDAALNAGRESISNNVNGVFAGAGRYGSAAHTGALTKGLGDLEMQARMANYETERAAQENAARTLTSAGFSGASMSPQLDAANLMPAQLQLQAGGLRDQIATAERTAPMTAQQWLASQSVPIAGLGGSSSGTATQTTKTPSNTLGMILGGAQMGLGLLSGNPMMAMGGGSSLLGGMGGGTPIGLGTASMLQNQWAANPGGPLPWLS